MDVSDLDLSKIRDYLSKDRLDKSNRYVHQKDRQLSIGVEILLRYALQEIGIYDPLFALKDYGKPYLKNHPDTFFNMSHSEKFVACAVSGCPIGVDIEQVHDIDLNIAKNYFFGSEYDYLLNHNCQKQAFFELWVLKESYMKMTGLGFRLALDEFCIEINDEIKLINGANVSKFGLWNVGEGEYMIGACSKEMVSEPVLVPLNKVENILSELSELKK